MVDPTPDEPAPDEPATEEPARDGDPADPSAQPPTDQWLAQHAVPGRVRRAPRFGSFVVTGALAGLVLGTAVALLAVPGSGLDPAGGGGILPELGGYTGVTLVSALVLGVLGGLAGAVAALWADRRSRR